MKEMKMKNQRKVATLAIGVIKQNKKRGVKKETKLKELESISVRVSKANRGEHLRTRVVVWRQ